MVPCEVTWLFCFLYKGLHNFYITVHVFSYECLRSYSFLIRLSAGHQILHLWKTKVLPLALQYLFYLKSCKNTINLTVVTLQIEEWDSARPTSSITISCPVICTALSHRASSSPSHASISSADSTTNSTQGTDRSSGRRADVRLSWLNSWGRWGCR